MDGSTWNDECQPATHMGWFPLLRVSLIEHRHFLAYCLFYLLAAWALLTLSTPDAASLLARNIGDLALAIFAPIAATLTLWFAIQFAVHLVKYRRFDLSRLAAEVRASDLLRPERIVRVLPVLASTPFVLGTFLSVKVLIGHLQPFSYDTPIIRLTETLNGGKPFWTYFETLFRHPWTVMLLNDTYYLWFPLLCATFVWRMFSFRDPHLRLQFLLTVTACWGLVGSFAAILFPSAGPAFLPHLLNASTPFDGLLAHLRNLQNAGYDLTALQVQDVLWKLYVARSDMGGSGISAMPSLHVTMAAVLAIHGWRLGLLAGLAYSIFALMIFLGSFLLAFHYAMDGVAGALAATAIWIAAGRLTDLVHPRRTTSAASRFAIGLKRPAMTRI
ncbi:phosphatase PAP2 family protein [Parvibaculum sp.]|uniref:phosphatase PAP2 family protein n=1 Tax=Parvibaculum sp. TaxID=2024848 RepID=UPI002C7A2711|nr:phosphatase PAP2 family protein [Parvibaculum sp.]HUD50578.1 phosphatase PAP2 family protein [Parvibaculum sp.]